MKERIKNFFIGVKTSWLYRFYLAVITLVITATYVGQVMETSIEDTWYSNAIGAVFAASVLYLTVFVLYLTGRGLYNWAKVLINK